MFKKILTAIQGFFTKEVPVVETAFNNAKGLVNVIKTFVGSATGQTLEAIIELVLPGASTAIFTALNTFFTDFGIVDKAATGLPSEIAAIGLNAVSKLTGDSKTLALSNVSAIIGNAASQGQSTLQQAIVSLPIVYNPNVLNATPTANPDPSTINVPDSPNV